ncbi:hypothetical protein VP01_175g7 [Puccinia sorghi]|uniref:Uncharacterized protein n=1 Tax=Puccinia sorghi TaxID=27349 RepID=A0A0L6VEW7_9BASI|nr:hypothetical protein VP01_175g7 [Puccinia sorghi]
MTITSSLLQDYPQLFPSLPSRQTPSLSPLSPCLQLHSHSPTQTLPPKIFSNPHPSSSPPLLLIQSQKIKKSNRLVAPLSPVSSLVVPSLNHSVPLPQCSNPTTATLNKQAVRSQTPLGTERAEDFSLSPDPLYSLPPLPTISVPIGYPKTQGEVNQDFSKVKPPSNQVPIHQFQNWINDNYLRSFGEDDLAFLASEYSSINGCPFVRVHVPTTNSTTTTTTTTTTNTVPAVAAVASTPNSINEGNPATTTKHAEVDEKSEDMTYVIPPLGRHYSEAWRDEDQGLCGSLKPHLERGLRPDLETRIPRLSHTDLDADALVSEKVHLGPLTERLISAIHPRSTCPSSSGSSLPRTANDTLASSSVLPKLDLMDNLELESRVTNELKLLGVIGEEETMDWTTRSDDEISLALRRTQSVLAQQSGRNRLRKGILSRLVKRRMAVQEFEAIKDGLERLLVQQMTKKNQLASLLNGARKSSSTPAHSFGNNNLSLGGPSDLETHMNKMRALDADIHRTLLKRHAFLARLRPLLLADSSSMPPDSSDGSSAPGLDQLSLQIPTVSIYPDFPSLLHQPII